MIDTLRYVSDIHLEINRDAAVTIDTPEGEARVNVAVPPFIVGSPNEALIVDGDLIPAIFLQARRKDKQSVQMQELFIRFIEQVKNFGLIFFVMGNHEAYHGYVNESAKFFRTYMYDVLKLDPKQFIVLDDEAYELSENVVLIGSTLWTDMRKDHPDAHQFVGNGMNDFKLCKINMLEGWDDDGHANLFTTRHAMEKHRVAKNFIGATAEANSHKRIIVVTHHAPSYQSNGRYHRGSLIMDGYCSDMEPFILDHPNITDWVHGHTHVNVDYLIGTTHVTSNMRGYVGHDASADAFTEEQFKSKFIKV
jgi:hypothetical protein